MEHEQEGGIVCAYLPSENTLLKVLKYTNEVDKNTKTNKINETLSGKGAIMFTYSNSEYDCMRWDEGEVTKRCASWTIKMLVKMNNITFNVEPQGSFYDERDKLKNQRARFIGKYKSMGYVTNQVYYVTIYLENSYIWLKCDGHIKCPYTLSGLFNNWKFL